MAALHLEMLRVATEDLNSKDAQLELLSATATLNERDLRAAQRENAELLAGRTQRCPAVVRPPPVLVW